jgi:hypothetical protein
VSIRIDAIGEFEQTLSATTRLRLDDSEADVRSANSRPASMRRRQQTSRRGGGSQKLRLGGYIEM